MSFRRRGRSYPFPSIIGDRNKGRDYADQGRWERDEEEQQKDVAADEVVELAGQAFAVLIQGSEPKLISRLVEFPPVMY